MGGPSNWLGRDDTGIMARMSATPAIATFRQGRRGLGAVVLVVVALATTRRPGLSCL